MSDDVQELINEQRGSCGFWPPKEACQCLYCRTAAALQQLVEHPCLECSKREAKLAARIKRLEAIIRAVHGELQPLGFLRPSEANVSAAKMMLQSALEAKDE